MAKKNYHAEQCAICKSKLRKEFDQRFLSGENINTISLSMGFEVHTGERHTKSTGLWDKRYSDALGCLKRVVARVEDLRETGKLPATEDTAVRAARVIAELQGKIQQSDPLFIILNRLEPEVKETLVESIKNRFADVGNTDN